jgi:hypothetical protein
MNKSGKNFTGMNSLAALRIAREFGCVIHHPRRTGEIVIVHPLVRQHIRISSERKDSPRVLTALIRKLSRITTQDNSRN